MSHFVLDHNFPIVVVEGLPWPDPIRLTSLYDYDPRLTRNHEDWQVLMELAKRGDVDGYISNDDRMLNAATEMVALSMTPLVLILMQGTGNDPLKATGLLMSHLVEITMRERENTRAQLYRLRAGNLGDQRRPLQEVFRTLADRANDHVDRMVSRERARIQAWGGTSADSG